MSKQLSLFATGINCGVCGNDPGMSSRNSALWPGFWDADMQIRVCNGCRGAHYKVKATTKHANLYSEVPVVVETTLLNERIELKPLKKGDASTFI